MAGCFVDDEAGGNIVVAGASTREGGYVPELEDGEEGFQSGRQIKIALPFKATACCSPKTPRAPTGADPAAAICRGRRPRRRRSRRRGHHSWLG